MKKNRNKKSRKGSLASRRTSNQGRTLGALGEGEEFPQDEQARKKKFSASSGSRGYGQPEDDFAEPFDYDETKNPRGSGNQEKKGSGLESLKIQKVFTDMREVMVGACTRSIPPNVAKCAAALVQGNEKNASATDQRNLTVKGRGNAVLIIPKNRPTVVMRARSAMVPKITINNPMAKKRNMKDHRNQATERSVHMVNFNSSERLFPEHEPAGENDSNPIDIEPIALRAGQLDEEMIKITIFLLETSGNRGVATTELIMVKVLMVNPRQETEIPEEEEE